MGGGMERKRGGRREKISGWTKGIKSSNGMKTIAAGKGRMKAKTASTAPPAKTLPKRRKENERIRDSSVTSSRMPTKNSINPWKLNLNRALKLKYLPSCSFHPSV